jgi:hypothetical protein
VGAGPHTRDHNHMTLISSESPRDLDGVKYEPAAEDPDRLAAALWAQDSLTQQKLRYGNSDPSRPPWLVASAPFVIEAALAERLERLGTAVGALCDASRRLYAANDPSVTSALDIGVPPDLRGHGLDRPIELFRLDIVLHNGEPQVTEMEEAFSGVGHMHAFEQAYGVSASALFQAFDALGIERVWMDDTWPTYREENELVAKRLKQEFHRNVKVGSFLDFHDDGRIGWRFGYVSQLQQYAPALRQCILKAADRLVNPPFHGYGTKALLSLIWDTPASERLAGVLDDATWRVLRSCVPPCRLLPGSLSPEMTDRLITERNTTVLKVVSSDDPDLLWGSRGVFFGGRGSGARWRRMMDAVAHGRVPDHPQDHARYLASNLVDSDRFNIEFLHPHTKQLCQMVRARVRLTPIYARFGTHYRLLCAYATFVNTSRKVHLGSHAVCTPVSTARQAGVPATTQPRSTA